jgi:hypothetical protein
MLQLTRIKVSWNNILLSPNSNFHEIFQNKQSTLPSELTSWTILFLLLIR